MKKGLVVQDAFKKLRIMTRDQMIRDHNIYLASENTGEKVTCNMKYLI
jgi:hypothetical protein